ncbi:MAG: hypothetical protein AB1640_10650 [bacterium]
MNPFVLVGVDLLVSVLIAVLVACIPWGGVVRLAWRRALVLGRAARSSRAAERAAVAKRAEPDGGSDPGDAPEIMKQAERLRRKGLSVVQIAGRLQVPTGEVEMGLALLQMGREGEVPGQDAGCTLGSRRSPLPVA